MAVYYGTYPNEVQIDYASSASNPIKVSFSYGSVEHTASGFRFNNPRIAVTTYNIGYNTAFTRYVYIRSSYNAGNLTTVTCTMAAGTRAPAHWATSTPASFTIPAGDGATSCQIVFVWSGASSGDYGVLTINGLPDRYTAPTGLAYENLGSTEDSLTLRVSVSSWGYGVGPNKKSFTIGEIGGGYARIEEVEGNELSSIITVNNDSREIGSLTISPNTAYPFFINASNTSKGDLVVVDTPTLVTMTRKLADCSIEQDGTSVDVSWTRQADGGALSRYIEYRYSSDGGATYTDWTFGMNASNNSGNFTINGFPDDALILLEVAISTEAGRTEPIELIFSTGEPEESSSTIAGWGGFSWGEAEWGGALIGGKEQSVNVDILGTTNVAHIIDTSVTGAVMVYKSAVKTITGTTRIASQPKKDISGQVLIEKSGIEDITGATCIAVTTDKSIDGVVRIARKSEISLYGTVDIEKDLLCDISGAVMIAGEKGVNIWGTVCIDNHSQIVSEQTIDGAVDILNYRSSDIDGNVMVSKIFDTSLSGNVCIISGGISDITGVVSIEAESSAEIEGAVCIITSGSAEIEGATFIEVVENSDINGQVNISKDQTAYISSVVRVENTSFAEIDGVVRVRIPVPEKLPEDWEKPDYPEPQEWDNKDKNPETWEDNTEEEPEEWSVVDKATDEWKESGKEDETWHYPIQEKD